MKAQSLRGTLRAGRLLLVLVLGTSLVYLPVLAQEEGSPAPAPKVPGLKSEALAFSLSFFGTLLPWLGVLAGVRSAWIGAVIGPSLGYFYAGSWGRGLLGIGVRSLSAAAIYAGAAIAVVSLLIAPGNVAGVSLAIGGLIWLASSTLSDISSIKKSVRAHNARLREKHLSLMPFYLPHSKSIGIQLSFSF